MKHIIYQLFIRAFGNKRQTLPGGSYSINGSGKFNDITPELLRSLREDLSISHIWYTGVIAHASKTDWSAYGIPSAHPSVVKGEAGSPYAITDYYDVAAELAEDIPSRMAEFEALVERTHTAGLRVVIDFVPNHLSRCYHGASTAASAAGAPSAAGGPSAAGALSAAGAPSAAGGPSAASATVGALFGAEDDPTQAFCPQNNFYYLPAEELHLPDAAQASATAATAASAAGGPSTAGAPSVAGGPSAATAAASAAAAAPYREYPAKATGNDCFSAWPSVNDWYDTVKLNYGVDYASGRTYFEPRPRTWGMMLDVLLFWASKGVDGFRCDMAEMVPVQFWHWAIAEVKHKYPQTLFVAEVYNPALYSSYLDYGGFDLLYDKVGMYDTLKLVSQHHLPASAITGAWQAVDKIQNRMLNFLENHDEQRLASSFNLGSPWRAIPELGVSLLFNRAPFMLYCAQEYGERGMESEGFSGLDGRTSIFDYCSIPAVREVTPEGLMLRSLYSQLLTLARTEIAFSQGYTFDLTYCNPQHSATKFIFARRPRKTFYNPSPEDSLIIICADFSFASQDEPRQIDVVLPDALFSLWNIPQGAEYKVQELLPVPAAASAVASVVPPAVASVVAPAVASVVASVETPAVTSVVAPGVAPVPAPAASSAPQSVAQPAASSANQTVAQPVASSATRAFSTATPQPVTDTMRTISSAAPLTINLNPIGLTIVKLVR
ncbi:MAG: alpha-amylase family glycosyl hydrolase [Candidatus Egerieousia sp.]|nr:alpha-amylase family glycosyl hydrolase [bacterium]MDY5255601.1 alpha-amylase family glycosyl hydrolase [Candidatus Egerieousia sp.]